MLFFSRNCLKHFILRRIERGSIINVRRFYHKCTEVIIYSCQILKRLKFSRQICEKYSNISFLENPSNSSRVAFHNFSNAPKSTTFKKVLFADFTSRKLSLRHPWQSLAKHCLIATEIDEMFIRHITKKELVTTSYIVDTFGGILHASADGTIWRNH